MRIHTPRQLSFNKKYNIKITGIFSNVKLIPHLFLREFMWKYFQGGLPFPHGKSCKHCGQELSHDHIFFQCTHCKEFWDQASRLTHLIYNTNLSKRRTINPTWSERIIWQLWAERNPKPTLVRSIAACTMYTIWKSRIDKPIPLEDCIAEHVADELTLAYNIREIDMREHKTSQIHKKWRTHFLWRNDGIAPNLLQRTINYMYDPAKRQIFDHIDKATYTNKSSFVWFD